VASRAGSIRYGSPQGRWILAATVLGSGISFLDGTVVNVALPAIGRDLEAGISGLQWTVDGYLLTLGSLVLLGGSLGDLYGRRRIFLLGLGLFTVASALCTVAPSIEVLILSRVLQGCGGALLVPGSLAMISASFDPADRGKAVGAWSGLAGVTTAVGPFLGGYLVDSVSWRFVFLINVPIAMVVAWITARHVPETKDPNAPRPDVPGAVMGALGLAGVIYALIESPGGGMSSPSVWPVALGGVLLLGLFFVVEARKTNPLLPLELFRSSQFSGANATTLAVYFALGGAMFFLVIDLQRVLGYSALEAGAALVPLTIVMLLLSPKAGALAGRIGPRLPMTFGPFVVAGGLLLLARVAPGTSYYATVLPGVVVFSLGLSLTVAPLTAAVLDSVETVHAGVGSGVNNAVARIAGLLAIAVLPLVVGVSGDDVTNAAFSDGYRSSMVVCAGLCVLGGLIAFGTIGRAHPIQALEARLHYRPRGIDHPPCGSPTPSEEHAATLG
jgi:EmrB/QacA subfamily drug resistance transporter